MTVRHASTRGLGDPLMLGRIDALFACGAREHVDIPQIVVVGDQSSGKSSVLSGLIRKDLPRDSGLCTRFATKIVFQRAPETSIRLTILPDDNASAEHCARVKAWGELNLNNFEEIILEEVMEEVHVTMGISGPRQKDPSLPTFSGDVLQLEISGPNQDHLSVIDVPGIFRDSTPGVTTMEDISFVKDMVHQYMANERSVMLAVLAANVDVATQEILQIASELDPEGERTLPVLTKPDLIDPGAEDQVIALVQGQTRGMNLGWHILRNPGKKDIEDRSYDRNRKEREFFSKRPWSCLDEDSFGIESLRSRLQDVLSDLVRKEFINVKNDVQRKLDDAEAKLKGLGPERDTRTAQSAYLTELSEKFQKLVDQALSAKFGTNDLFEDHEELKVPPAVVLRMGQFRQDLALFGHKYLFEAPKYDEKNRRSKAQVRKLKKRVDDLDNFLFSPQVVQRSGDDTKTHHWLEKLYNESRGFEIGTFDPVIIASAMRKQTEHWESISLGFLSDIVVLIHGFVETALSSLCANERLIRELYNAIFDEAKRRYMSAFQQANFILNVEIKGTPMTRNPLFIEKLDERRSSRLVSGLEQMSMYDPEHGPVVRLGTYSPKRHLNHEAYTIQDIHDILQSYYEVARERFIDNICNQAVDHFLVNGPETPLRVLTPGFISRMTDEQLEQIAGEEPKVQKQRKKLKENITSLRKAREILS